MQKLSLSDDWYKKALENEEGVEETTAGPLYPRGSKRLVPGRPAIDIQTEARIALSTLFRNLRVNRHLTIAELGKAIDVNFSDLLLVERNPGFMPPSEVLSKLSTYHGLPDNFFSQATSFVEGKDESLMEDIAKYAVESASLEALSAEEERLLNGIVKVIHDKAKVERPAIPASENAFERHA